MAVAESGPHRAGNHLQPIALWVVPVSALGGVARHVVDAAEAGIPGFELVVLTPEGPLADELRRRRVRVAVGRFGPDVGIAASIRTLKTAAERLRPAVVHSHLSYADVIVAVAPLPRQTLRVTTEHGIAGDDRIYHGSAAKSALMAAVHSARLRRFDVVIAVSSATKQAMIEKWAPSQDIRVILNGVDPVVSPDPSGTTSGSLRILALARLSPEKRIPQLLKAFKLVLDVRPDARLTVAGIGDLDGELKALARELHIDDAVSFPGFVEPNAAMAESDVLAQLSVWENCSYSLLDAANLGMRVVASNVGGNPEIVDSRGLVDADDIQGVARALLNTNAHTRITDWPTVREMTTAIAETYVVGGARGGRERARVEHITLATNNGDVGGGEVMLLSLAEMLVSVGTGVTIVGPSKPQGFVAAARAQGHDVVELPAVDRRSWMRALRAWDSKHRRGMLWCNGLVPAAATAGHRDRIVHLHILPKGMAQKSLVLLARLGARKTLVPSDWMREKIRGATTLSNWTSELEQVSLSQDGADVTILGFLGRPSVAKGVLVLAQALHALEKRHPGKFRLRLGGEPYFVSESEKQAVELALKPVEGLVDRVGWVARDDFFRAIDLLVVPSVWPETFGLVAAEAMAAGIPVIVSDAGALADVVGQPEDVFAANDVQQLVAVILRKHANGLESHVDQSRERWTSHFSPVAARARLNSLLNGLGRQ